MKTISWVIVFLGFILLRINQLGETTLMYEGDDYDYFAHASSIAFLEYPSYEKEYAHHLKDYKIPLGAVGAGLMASPFVAVFSLLDRLEGSSIVQLRTHDNIKTSWSAYGFLVATAFYFWFACYLLYRGLRKINFTPKASALTILALILLEGVPLYLFRRPMFTHVYELFCQSVLMSLLLMRAGQKPTLSFALLVGLLTSLVALVRYNNVPTAMLWPIVIFMMEGDKFALNKNWRWVLLDYCVIALMAVIFKYWPMWSNQAAHEPYLQVFKGNDFFLWQGADYYLSRLVHILFGVDWGLIFTAPFCLIGLVWFVTHTSWVKRRVTVLLLPLLVNLFFIINWNTQGGWYGYRYLIFSLMPLLVVSVAEFIVWVDKKYGTTAIWILGLISLQPFLSMIGFEANKNLNLEIIEQFNGKKGWGNAYYQLEIWKNMVLHPHFIIRMAKKAIAFAVLYWVWKKIVPVMDASHSIKILIIIAGLILLWFGSGLLAAAHTDMNRIIYLKWVALVFLPMIFVWFSGKCGFELK